MKKYLELLIHISIWGIAYFLFLNSVTTIADFKKDEGPLWLAILFGMVMNQIIFYATAFSIVPRFLRLKKIALLIIILIGAFILITLPEILRFVELPDPVAANLRLLIYGFLLIILMLVRPQGLAGNYRYQ